MSLSSSKIVKLGIEMTKITKRELSAMQTRLRHARKEIEFVLVWMEKKKHD